MSDVRLTERQWRAALAAYLLREVEASGGVSKLSKRMQGSPYWLDRVPLGNKVRRGSFGADFLLELCRELGVEKIDVAAVAQLAPPPESEG